MGKRGPQTGSTYKKRRILIPRELKVRSDRELSSAQRFNDALENFLVMFLDEGAYPLNGIQATLVEQVVESVEVLQGAILEGIQAHYARASPSLGAGGSATGVASPPGKVPEGDEENFLPGSYGLGTQRGRKPRASGEI